MLYSQIEKDSLLEAKINLKLGYYYLTYDSYTQGLEYAVKAQDFFQKHQMKKHIADTYQFFGSTYLFLDNEKASSYYEQALEIYKQLNDSLGMASLYSSLSRLQLQKREYDQARSQLLSALQIFKNRNNALSTMMTLKNLGDIEISTGNVAAAKTYIDEAYQVAKESRDTLFQGHLLLHYGYLHQEEQNYNRAIEMYEKGLEQAGDFIDIAVLRNLSDLYIQKNDYKKGNDYLVQYYQLADSLRGAKVKSRIDEVRWSSQVKEQEYQNKLLNTELEVEKQKRLSQTKTYAISILVICGIVFTVFSLYRNNKKSLRISELEKNKLAEKVKTEIRLKKMHQERYEYELDKKNRELTVINAQLLSKNHFLSEVEQIIDYSKDEGKISNELKTAIRRLNNQEKDWERFKTVFQKVHPAFFETIQTKYPQLSKAEIKICTYIKTNMDIYETASLLNMGHRSLITARSRIRKKLNIEKEIDLDEFVKTW
ncbi:tetratricopeptide repeat protein [Myroides indicus]|uniref:Tetratricopeptide repeat protein n=1 Tax=Myroides indicus TaxID=1323422 RepID=A0A4R7EWT7_9FLAO|nr:tetratricopeptide repeat protein [Myroides indicus]TDS57926.1 tetratricopeptide repeat protein [Myroides indicus]